MTEATFTAPRLDEAMNLVKRALGPDAFILSSRKVDIGGSSRFEVRATKSPAAAAEATAARPERSPLERRLIEAGVLEGETAPLDPRTHPIERILTDNDVDREFVSRIVTLAGPAERSIAERRAQLLRVIRRDVGFGDRARTRLVSLVGPTGVGKTTTIAKLAARDLFSHGLRVALVSLDQYRIGGADQLARYAELMGAPFASAADSASLGAAIRDFAAFDRVYIDTAGRAPRDRQAMADLARTLRSTDERISTLLAITASTRRLDLATVLSRHAGLEPVSIIVTKLDEASHVGGPLSAALKTGLPLAWFTTGQRVPEDIEPASAERLVDALFGEEVAA